MPVYPASLQPLAELAAKIRTPDFLPAFGRLLDNYFPGINLAVFFYQQDQRPVTLVHNLSYEQEINAIFALEKHYQDDPFFQFWQSNRKPCLKTLEDVIPADFYHSPFYNDYYARLGLYDEVMAYFPLSEQQCIAVSFGFYNHRKRCKRDEALELIVYLFPVLQALFEQYWLSSSLHDNMSEGEPLYVSNQFAAEILTARERQVVQLILQGLASKQIAGKLNIQLGTVKNHRKNIYKKLQINSQQELYHQFWLYQNQEQHNQLVND
ncbi:MULTISPECIES: response regulator transcription factor [Photobacterium]|uniref:response regulator transcription factor n=1 Tax=Photobacterium TaxID=657 RepID=UPI000EA149D5|nr:MULTISPECIES: response regulator transcription factor [Photobacterium]UIP30513.1 response regulator transcription factor [Photobacterium sp. TLY01]